MVLIGAVTGVRNSTTAMRTISDEAKSTISSIGAVRRERGRVSDRRALATLQASDCEVVLPDDGRRPGRRVLQKNRAAAGYEGRLLLVGAIAVQR
jgi:hypothetical protein